LLDLSAPSMDLASKSQTQRDRTQSSVDVHTSFRSLAEYRPQGAFADQGGRPGHVFFDSRYLVGTSRWDIKGAENLAAAVEQ
jgi:hypothetical protein